MAGAHIHQMDPYKVGEIKTLGMWEDSKARQLLEQVAKQVQPLLRRHSLHVPLLSEFYPRNPGLLGLNIGGGGGSTREIRIRLRRAGRELDFFDYMHILGTMLHEMVHNHHGAHDDTFYMKLDQYTEECEELMAKGVSGTGAGFDAPTAGRVGGRFAGRELNPRQRREMALKAAEERLKKQTLMPAGPRKLGGDLSLRLTCDARQAAAIAAERRARDNLWCPAERLGEEEAAGHSIDSAIQQVLNAAGADANGGAGPAAPSQQQQQQQQPQQRQRQQAEERQRQPPLRPIEKESASPSQSADTSAQPQSQQQPSRGKSVPTMALSSRPQEGVGGAEVIDLTGADEDEAAGARAGATLPAGEVASVPPAPKRHRQEAGSSWGWEGGGSSAAGSWACPRCTLLNRGLALSCDACGAVKPAGFTAP